MNCDNYKFCSDDKCIGNLIYVIQSDMVCSVLHLYCSIDNNQKLMAFPYIHPKPSTENNFCEAGMT